MKILVVCTTDSMVWNFLIPHIDYWIKQNNIVEIACSRTGFYFDDLINHGFILHEMPFNRNPFHFSNVRAVHQLKKIADNNFDIIISQEPVGGAIGRIVGKLCGLKNVYTAHGFHFYNGAPIKYWLLYYPVERLLSYFTDVLITINQEDYNRAKRFHAKKVVKIDGIGVDLKKFHNQSEESHYISRKKNNIPDNSFVVLTVAEMIPRKNYFTALKAIKKCGIDNVLYLVCGDGLLESSLRNIAVDLGISSKVRFLGFRKDVNEIYQASDVFLFPSFQEGLSIALIEAMASGLPILCSDIRGNNDLVVDKHSGFLYKPEDVDGFSEGLNYCHINDTSHFAAFNLERVKRYSIERSIKLFYDIIISCK